MTPERWQQVKAVLQGALELAPEQRPAFLDHACSADQSLREDVESLLASSDEECSTFLQSSATRVTLTKGTRLGDYEVQSLIGSGGMGEVYRARDRRLDRGVAIKVLPSFLSSDPDRLRRFEQEARAAAALNHPNILAVLQMGTYEGAPYLVSELLEGLTLREHLRHGPLPIRKALDYAIQIAHGLAAAHDKGIVHRDLKPENLFVTKDGRIKILDFGLAKLTQPKVDSMATTRTLDEQTEPGVVMGTAGYISPEQVRGETADHRADIFAFGAILYEMLTGKRAFQGATAVEAMGAILKEDPPPVDGIVPAVPLGLQRIVHRCLEKDPDRRFRTASDLAFALESLSDSGAASPVGLVLLRGKRSTQAAWGLAALLPILTVVATLTYFRVSGKKPTPITAFLPPPPQATIEFVGDTGGPPVLSPDGRFLAFTGASAGTTQLWLRALDAEKAQPLARTEGATFPFWSADSRTIGFFAGGKMERIDVSGGTPISLCDAPEGRGGAWSKDGVIVFSPDFRSGLLRVSAWGGIPVAVTKLDPSKHTTHRWPYFLPDGKHLLYLALNHASPSGENTAIYEASLDGKEDRLLFRSKAGAVYASGYLLFLRDSTLMAQHFDAAKRELDGEPVPVAANVQSDPGTWRPIFSASDSGLLVYEESETNGTQLAWLDRSGKQIGTLGDRKHYGNFRVSPHADKVAVELGEPSNIWIYDVARGVRTRLTFNPAQDTTAVWSPDESQIVFTSDKNGPGNLYRKAANGTGLEEILLASSAIKEAQDWSPDGRFLLYNQTEAGSLGQLWILPLFGDRKPFPFVQSRFSNTGGAFSPDQRWVAYASDESGRSEVYVVPFRGLASAGVAGKWQVSTGGGILPIWRRDGRELLYIEPDLRAPFYGIYGRSPVPSSTVILPGARLMAVQVSTAGSEFKIGKVRPLFTVPSGAGLDATSDGQRFLIEAVEQSSAPLTLVVNWTARLKP